MTHKYGPMIKAVVLILQSYKACLYVCADIEKNGDLPDLTKTFMILYNEEFFSEEDRVDCFLERLFDILDIPKQPVLRKCCVNHILEYIANKEPILPTIQKVLEEKNSYAADPEKYLKEHK